jgi:hypothetical protein
VPGIARTLEVLDKSLSLACVWRDLSQPNSSLDRFDLAEERSRSLKIVFAPVLQQPGGLRRNLPRVRIRSHPPFCELLAQLFDPAAEFELLLLS